MAMHFRNLTASLRQPYTFRVFGPHGARCLHVGQATTFVMIADDSRNRNSGAFAGALPWAATCGIAGAYKHAQQAAPPRTSPLREDAPFRYLHNVSGGAGRLINGCI